MNRILKPLIFLLAAIYFLVDAVFLTVAKPLANWVAEHWIMASLRVWIVSLSPYPTLSLFALPLIILEPIKPIAAYLVGTGHILTGLITLIVGEILKLVLVERLFNISRDKLLSIPAFAWAYFKYCAAKDSLTSMEAWQIVRRWSVTTKYFIRSYALKLRAVQSRHRVTLESR